MSPASLVVLARLLATMRNLIDTMITVVENEIGAVAPDAPEIKADEDGMLTKTFGGPRRQSPGRSTNPAPITDKET